MIRRFGCIRLTAASHARTFVFADVKLTSLLPTGPVGSVTSPASVNDFIKQHKLTIPPIENNLTLTAWAALSAERKQTLMPAGSDFFDGHPELEQDTLFSRNMRALTHLTSLGVETIGQFGQSTANISQLDSGVRGFLNQTVRPLQDFFNPIVAAFKERVDTSNLTATVPKPYAAHLRMRELTYRHPYGDKLHMLGEDRISTLERIVLNSFEPLDSKKEDNPINYLIAAPRQGKSLMLDEVVARAASLGHGFYGVGISFNNKSTLRMQDISKSVRTVTSEFWGRVAHSLYLAMLPEGAPELNFGSFRELPFFGVFNCDVVHALAQKLKLGRVVIAADEISKLTAMIVKQGFSKEDEKAVMTTITEMYSRDWSLLCSGFTMRDAYVMATKSGRPTMEHFLCMVSRQTCGFVA